MFDLAGRALRCLDPETAHAVTLAGLKLAARLPAPKLDPRLKTEVFGLTFPSRVGMAAGFDKNAEACGAAPWMGLGFWEVGTVTPERQFRVGLPWHIRRFPEERSIVNRLGLPNDGSLEVLCRMRRLLRKKSGIVGVSLGANSDSSDLIGDFVMGVGAFSAVADYLVLNVSCPNVQGFRDLHWHLRELFERVLGARAYCACAGSAYIPILLKISPDVTLSYLDEIVRVARDTKIDGMIISNTSRLLAGGGGLSGWPIFVKSTRLLANAYLRVEGQFPLIGTGGICTAVEARAKCEAGASLIQLYTGLVYAPGLAFAINDEFAERPPVVGSQAETWALDWAGAGPHEVAQAARPEPRP